MIKCKNDNDNDAQSDSLGKKVVRMEKELEAKLGHATKHCLTSSEEKGRFVQRMRKECVVLWDEIEELSSALNDFKQSG